MFILIVYTYNWLHKIWYLFFTCVLLILLICCEVHSKVQIYFGNDSPWLALHTKKNSKALDTPQNTSLHSQNRIMEMLPLLWEFNFGQNLRDKLGCIGNFLGNKLKNDVNTWKIHENLMKICGEKKLGFMQYHHATKKKKERRWRL